MFDAIELVLYTSKLFARNNMATARPRHAKDQFEIHHDEMDESMEQTGAGDESRVEDGEEMEVDGYSEASDDTDEAVDLSVQQDMVKFEEKFQDIKERFRLINRIGEGKLVLIQFTRGSPTNLSQEPFRLCTRPKISCTMRTLMTGISRKRKMLNGHRLRRSVGPHPTTWMKVDYEGGDQNMLP